MGAGVTREHFRRVEVGGQLRRLGEARRELAEDEVLAALVDDAERERIPQDRGTAVAEDDLIVVGQREQLREALFEPAHHGADRGLAVTRSEKAGCALRERLDRLRPHLGGAGAEPAVGRPQLARNDDVDWIHVHPLAGDERGAKRSSPYHAGVSHSRLAQRVLDIAESPTLAVDARAKALAAAGVDVVGFGAGEPDFPTPQHIVDAAAAAASDPRFHHYTPAPGLPELRTAVAAKTRRDSGFEVEPNQVLVSNGGKHAVYNALMSVVGTGDDVLLPAPYWVSYPELIKLAGGRVVPLPTSEATGFRVTPDELERAATSSTKLLVFVSPS